MNTTHEMARALVLAHQRDLERDAATRRFARRTKHDRRRS